MAFILFISFVILLRIGELLLSKQNEKWLLENNAVEYGKKHYPIIVALHILFFVSLIFEYCVTPSESCNPFLLIFYFILIFFKVWVILSLGVFWNTKIYRIANTPPIKTGPYKYLKHPNYLIVVAEIAIIPLIFHLYYTALIFSVLNLVVLSIRVREENKALQA